MRDQSVHLWTLDAKMTAPLPAELMENALLAKLRDEDRQHLAPHMMRIDMGAFAVLQQAGEDVVNTWFPCGTALAAFRVWIGDNNPAVEVALVGNEGAGASSRTETFRLLRRATSRRAGSFSGSRPPLLSNASSTRFHCGTGFHVMRIVCSLKYSRLQHATPRTQSCSGLPSGSWQVLLGPAASSWR